MKKIIFIAFAAILAGFAISCQKEESVSEKTEAVQYTFNITVNDQVGFDSEASTKGGSSETYKTGWLNGDKIFLFFKPTGESLLTNTYATLTYYGSSWDGAVTGSSSLGEEGTLSAVYVYNLGDVTPEFSDDQWTIATGNTFYNCQTEVSYTVSGSNEISASLNLEAPANFVRFSVYSASGALTCDKVKGWKDIAIGSDLAVSNVTCTGYMDGFTNSGDSNFKEYYGRIVSGTSLEGVTCKFSVVKNGTVYERTATPSSDARSFKINAGWTEAEGKLPGLFTISIGSDDKEGTADDIQVRFSQGNLWYGKVGSATTATFNFEANQYDTTPASGDFWSSDHISHFYWSKSVDEAVKEEYNWVQDCDENDVFFTNETETTSKNDFTVNVGGTEQTGWRTLSKDEWCYLFAYDPSTSRFIEGHPRKQLFKYGVTVCDKVNCVVLLPDNWNETIISLTNFATQTTYNENSTPKWSEMETAGAVCLPAAGRRLGPYVNDVGFFGYYWSSSADGRDLACIVLFNSSDVSPGTYGSRSFGFSVRLITECQ